MSYTFLVFPAEPRPFDPEALATRSAALLRSWLESLPFERMVELSDALLAETHARLASGAAQVRISLREAGSGAWSFSVEPGAGRGTIARSSSSVQLSQAERYRIRSAGLEERWLRASRVGWCFEIGRMLGEPALSAVAHGFVAMALAEQQEGLIHSVDGAWDASVLPCGPETFASSFMRPERSAGERYRRYAEDKVRAMPDELGLFDPAFVRSVLEQIASRLVSDINCVRGDRQAELRMLDRALSSMETARVLTGGSPEAERQLLIGSGSLLPEDRGGAIGRLCPTAEEYDRWLGRIGERLP